MPIKLNFVFETHGPFMEPTPRGEIEAMKEEYKNTMKADDSLSGWVSKDELLQLINDNKANGVRIYFGRHLKDDANNKYKKGQLNVILVATLDSTNPANPTTYNSKDQLNSDPNAGAVNTVTYSGSGGDAIPLCPPVCEKL